MSKKRRFFRSFRNRPFYEKLAIPIDIFEKIRAFTAEAEGEISAFGRTVLVENDLSNSGTVVLVKEFEIFEQICEPTHTSLQLGDLSMMYAGVGMAGGNPEEWNFWWHSHVNMGTGFSAEDDNTMTDITKAKNGQEGSMLTALCTNKSGDYTATIYRNGRRLMNELSLMVLPSISIEVTEDARKIIEEKITYERISPFSGFSREAIKQHLDMSSLSKNKRRKIQRYS